MVPGPSTTTVSPQVTPPTAVALLPTLSGSNSAARVRSVSGARELQLNAGTLTRRLNAPSRDRPSVFLLLHRWTSPARQVLHRRQLLVGMTATDSFSLTLVTFAPVAITVPENSWPSVRGRRERMKS